MPSKGTASNEPSRLVLLPSRLCPTGAQVREYYLDEQH